MEKHLEKYFQIYILYNLNKKIKFAYEKSR